MTPPQRQDFHGKNVLMKKTFVLRGRKKKRQYRKMHGRTHLSEKRLDSDKMFEHEKTMPYVDQKIKMVSHNINAKILAESKQTVFHRSLTAYFSVG